MNREQKIAWFKLAICTFSLICAGLTVWRAVVTVGYPSAWGGFSLISISFFTAFGPLIFPKKHKGKTLTYDERDALIDHQAGFTAFAAFFAYVVTICLLIMIIAGPQARIPAISLASVVTGGWWITQVAEGLAVLIQYGRGGAFVESQPKPSASRRERALSIFVGLVFAVLGILFLFYFVIPIVRMKPVESPYPIVEGKTTNRQEAHLVAIKLFSERKIPTDTNQPGEGLHIVFASYGTKHKWLDVTQELRDKLKENKLSIHAGNSIAGDPHYLRQKTLIVDYIRDGTLKKIESVEGLQLRIH